MPNSAQEKITSQLIKVADAALYLGISPSSLRRFESEGKISSERLENNYRVYKLEKLNRLKNELENKKEKKEEKKEIVKRKKIEYRQRNISKILENQSQK